MSLKLKLKTEFFGCLALNFRFYRKRGLVGHTLPSYLLVFKALQLVKCSTKLC